VAETTLAITEPDWVANRAGRQQPQCPELFGAYARRDLLNKQNDGGTQFCIFDAHERLHQIQAVGCREEIVHVRGRGCVGRPLRRLREAGRCRRALEEKRNRHLKDLGEVLQAARADAIGPLLILLDLLECHPYRVRYIGLAHTSMRRRMRKRLPTCLSVGFALFGICAPG
jgi:hypothetical protein